MAREGTEPVKRAIRVPLVSYVRCWTPLTSATAPSLVAALASASAAARVGISMATGWPVMQRSMYSFAARKGTMTHDCIEINPAVLLGKPVIRGTRIPVELVLRKLSKGATEADLLDAYPRLTPANTVAHEAIILQTT